LGWTHKLQTGFNFEVLWNKGFKHVFLNTEGDEAFSKIYPFNLQCKQQLW